jgi:hypothetical protein
LVSPVRSGAPTVGPEAVHTIGPALPAREPMTAIQTALVTEARPSAPMGAEPRRTPRPAMFFACGENTLPPK